MRVTDGQAIFLTTATQFSQLGESMKRTFRKYHRTLSLVVVLPLILTLLTGMAATLSEEWSVPMGLSRSLLMRIHTGEIFHLGSIYPLLNGLGLAVMVVTGLSMTSLFSKRSQQIPNA
jgi:hypothetical protein